VIINYINVNKSNNCVPAIAFSCLKTTSSVLPASLSSSFSPMHGNTFNPEANACLTFSPINLNYINKLILFYCNLK
jgi:hypothetical protein